GPERVRSRMVARNTIDHAALGLLPKLRVAGSNSVVRFKEKPRLSGLFLVEPTRARRPRWAGRARRDPRRCSLRVVARLVGINHVALEVGDVGEALAFYGRFFSFEL